jgi:GT2 family glycosyltransferase
MHFESRNLKLVVLGYTPFAKEIKRTSIVSYYEDFWERVFQRVKMDINRNPHGNFITNNLSLRKDFLIQVNLFDEDFKNYSYEDTELGYRLLKNGMDIRFNEKAIAYHYFEIDLERSCKQQFQSGYSAVLFYKKHPELKAQLSIDVVSGDCDKATNMVRKIWRFLKQVIYNNCFIKVMKKIVVSFDRVLPQKVLFTLYGIIHWHNYLSGIKEGLKKK